LVEIKNLKFFKYIILSGAIMKKWFKYLMILLIVPIAFLVAGCTGKNAEAISIKDIKKTDTIGELVDVYTITYTNGKTDNFTIVNGEDGLNLYNNITINDLYNQVKGSKPAGYTLIDFIDEYLDIKLDTNAVASANALRSAVSIFVEHKITIPDYSNPIQFNPLSGYTYGIKNSVAWGAGAGVIYELDKQKGDAYIITNYHVCYSSEVNAIDGIATRFTTYIYGAETIDLADLYYLGNYNNKNTDYADKFEFDNEGLPVIDYGFGAIEAEYIGGSESYDIAVLKVTGSEVLKNSDCKEVDIYDSNNVTAGASAIAVGNPDACGISVTNGVVSVDSEYVSFEIGNSAVNLREFRIDTPVNPGNSGGGLFDGFGRLIGIVNGRTKDTSIQNINYAIPSNIAIGVAECIIDTCDGIDRKLNRVLVGISLQTINSKAYYDDETGLMNIVETVAIGNVNQNSLAEELGLNVGDVITSVKIVKEDEVIEKDIKRSFALSDAMLLVRVGDSVIFSYSRNGVEGTFVTTALTEDYFIEIK
jgi:S1-C subfamily serine protease